MVKPSDPDWVALAFSLVPLVLLVGGLFWFMWRSRSAVPRPGIFDDYLAIEREALEERKETNRLLSEIAAKLER